MKTGSLILAALTVIASLLPIVRADDWWIRVFDFPRAQIAALGVLAAGGLCYAWDLRGLWVQAALGLVVLCVGYQAYMMFPYTVLARPQVRAATEAGPGTSFSLLIANVLMENRNAERFLALVREHDPDLILTVETDAWWERALRALEPAYPYTVKRPMDNTYGMLLHARLPLIDPQVEELVDPGIPSLHTQVRLPSGVHFYLHGLHPRPPYPTEDTSTTERDAELLIVGQRVRARGAPAVVAGDLNDVAWSHTTTLFQKISGLLDPRVGRGMYSTFHAGIPLMRWPLDHVFHSEHFELVQLRRLPAWGSDHFPMLIRLRYHPEAPERQEQPEAAPEERRRAHEKIEKAWVEEVP